MDSLVGRTLSHYRILAELGRGGMGVVYRATDTRLQREVAIKVLPPDLLADDERRQRFLREAQTSSQLSHPNVGVVYDVDEAEGVGFIAMELIRGERLVDVIARGSLSAGRTLDLAIEIAEGLAAAHDKGIIHRDLKPANVMVTDQGHAKIIDFGLAKLVESAAGTANDETRARLTVSGVAMGTTSHMSPEQARAARVDHRSDIFSFGVTLYQMLSGQLPFRGTSGLETINAILHGTSPVLPSLGPDVPAAAAADLQRIVEKCLAKEPDGRYQGARDLIVDLRAARRRLESGATVTTPSGPAAPGRAIAPGRPKRTRLVAMAAVGVVLAVAAVFLWPRLRPAPTVPVLPGERPSLAVMYFQNNTGDADLDWLRTGLAEMLVTDLSQSTSLEVLPTDRLYQILASLKRQNDPVISFETVQAIARQAGVQHVLVGNYLKAGDTIRINVTLQDAASGRILTSERVESASQSSLFPTVDDLTRRLHDRLVPAAATAVPALITRPGGGEPPAGLLRSLEEVTTSSIEAYRLYVEGVTQHERGFEREAEPLLKQAIDIDPEFALAMARLSAVENNLRHPDEGARFAAMALAHAGRLTPVERLYIEAFAKSGQEETIGEAIDAYQKLLAISPHHVTGRHNLSFLYDALGRTRDAIPLLEGLYGEPTILPFTYGNLASDYAAMDEFDKAHDVLSALLQRNPADGPAHRLMAELFVEFGRVDEATAELDRADALDGSVADSLTSRWAIARLRDRDDTARAVAEQAARTAESFNGFFAVIAGASNDLYRGRASAAIERFNRALANPGNWGVTLENVILNVAARLDLDLGRPAQALDLARRSANQDTGGLNAGLGLGMSRQIMALAQSRLGRATDAAATAALLTKEANALPGDVYQRLAHDAAGVMALESGDRDRAISELTDAERRLTPRAANGPPPPHPVIWFDLAQAYLAKGDDAQARRRLERLIAGAEHLAYPLQFVRSLYLLGQIAERAGDRDKAREYYQRFVGYWGDGEIDRDKVAEAKNKIGALR